MMLAVCIFILKVQDYKNELYGLSSFFIQLDDIIGKSNVYFTIFY